jgi:hypothetical protein
MNETNNIYIFFSWNNLYGDMYMENISLSLYNIPGLLVPIIRIYLQVLCITKKMHTL